MMSALRRSFILIALSLGLAAPLGGCAGAPKNDTFDFSVDGKVVSGEGVSFRAPQVLIAEPTALKALDSENILVRLSHSEVRYLGNSQWSDRLPRLVQSKLVQAFEDSGKFGGVGRPGQGLAIDYQVATDIRVFEVEAAGNIANIELSVKLINDRNGTVKAQNVFRTDARAKGDDNANLVKALDQAFSTVSRDIVAWTLRSL